MNETLYRQHLEVLEQRWQAALEFSGMDAAVIAAGEPRDYFLDDQAPPFRPNPHFAQWFPDRDCAGAALLVAPGKRPRLFFHQPRDFWHQPPSVPGWAGAAFDVAVFDSGETLRSALQAAMAGCNRLAVVAEEPPQTLFPEHRNPDAVNHNPPLLLNHLHFGRALKTAFEVDCMVDATARGVAGHVAARQAFREGLSEFDTHMRYLAAARQTAADLPYSSIVAHNGHAGVLHYQHYDREVRPPLRSFLIDAGATANGYASDITRTYAAPEQGDFAGLIAAMDELQLGLIASIRPDVPYPDLHAATHRALAALLVNTGLLDCSPEAALEQGLTRTFLPHGVGHLIGLQTHDVGGQQASAEGGLRPPPEEFPALRFTRDVAVDMVFTIEPGLYFIPMLLDALRASPAGAVVDWPTVDALTPCGGIRIEDNVVVTADGVRNLTRDAFARHD